MEEQGSFSQSPFTSTSSQTSSSSGSGKGGGKAKKIIFLVIILLILGAVAYGATVLLGGSASEQPAEKASTDEFFIPTDTPTPEEATPTPEEEEDAKATPTPTAKVSATPTPSKKAGSSIDSASGLDRADLSIIVQNGSGEAGVAKVMADKLTGLGYVISSTGNADNYDYTGATIQVKSADKAFLALLKKDLEDDYTITTATSDYTGTGDALIIVGK